MQVWHCSDPGGESVNSTGYPTLEKPIRARQINTIQTVLVYTDYYYLIITIIIILIKYFINIVIIIYIIITIKIMTVNPLLTLTPTIQTQSNCFNMDTSLLHTVLFSWQKKLMMPNFIYTLSLLHRHFHKTDAWVLH